jgi:hypothetical protein
MAFSFLHGVGIEFERWLGAWGERPKARQLHGLASLESRENLVDHSVELVSGLRAWQPVAPQHLDESLVAHRSRR